jgi:hypothetical protein
MNLIRGFLWTLVAVMTIQGYLQADEYGSAISMIGGVGLTMSVWQEKAASWFATKPVFVPLPRVIVEAALKETTLHPGIQMVPKLQVTLRGQQRIWDLFREEEIAWLLRHADLVGAVQSDPDARTLWTVWHDRLNRSEMALQRVQGRVCRVRALNPTVCNRVDTDVTFYERERRAATAAVAAWRDVLYIGRYYSAEEWTVATSAAATQKPVSFASIRNALARLHDIEQPTDPRLIEILRRIQEIQSGNVWRQRLLVSLLTGEAWAACLEHVRLREGRTRELMMVAGVQDMMNAHERILNASLRVVRTNDDRGKIHDWFGEISGYAWFLPDSIPSLVRRCVGQETGDCRRIGPTEIVTLTEREVNRSQIAGDWPRRLFIGMWNAMPVVGILFLLEVIMLCVPVRTNMVFVADNKMPMLEQ